MCLFTDGPHIHVFTFLPLECNRRRSISIFIGSLATNVNVSGRVCFPGLDNEDLTFQFSPGDGDFFQLPPTVIPDQSFYNSSRFSTIVITSDQKISVYGAHQCNSVKYDVTAFRVIPVDSLGTEYRITLHWIYGESQIGIVAISDDLTSVNIHQSAIVSINVVLRQYEVYYFGGDFDVTGTRIASDKVIFVTIGNVKDAPEKAGKSRRDVFSECLNPVPRWGTKFSFVDFPEHDKNYQIRLFAEHDDTEVTLTSGDNETVLMLQSGDSFVESYSNESIQVHSITSSHPVLVIEISGEVAMHAVPSLPENASSSLTLPVFEIGRPEAKYFIDVWMPPMAMNYSIWFNDNSTDQLHVIGHDKFSNLIVRMSCSVGLHTLKSDGNIFKMAVVYGMTDRQSYNYLVN